jgi:hypothetical protein
MTSLTGASGYNSAKGPYSGQRVGHSGKIRQVPNFSPEQMDLFQHLFSHAGPESYLSRLAGGDESLFGEIEAPALRQFSGLQGNIASRFSQGGGSPGGRQEALGSRRSSGFQNTLGGAASDFALQLQSQRQGLQRQAIMDLMGLSSNLLGQKPYDTFVEEPRQRQSSGWGGFLGGALGGIGGLLTGGPAGIVPGAKLGYNAGSFF